MGTALRQQGLQSEICYSQSFNHPQLHLRNQELLKGQHCHPAHPPSNRWAPLSQPQPVKMGTSFLQTGSRSAHHEAGLNIPVFLTEAVPATETPGEGDVVILSVATALGGRRREGEQSIGDQEELRPTKNTRASGWRGPARSTWSHSSPRTGGICRRERQRLLTVRLGRQTEPA